MGINEKFFAKMKDFPETFDVEFVVDGLPFPAHRAWFASTSPAFRSMVVSGMKDSKKHQIQIREVSAGTWQYISNYVYFETVVVDDMDEALKFG